MTDASVPKGGNGTLARLNGRYPYFKFRPRMNKKIKIVFANGKLMNGTINIVYQQEVGNMAINYIKVTPNEKEVVCH